MRTDTHREPRARRLGERGTPVYTTRGWTLAWRRNAWHFFQRLPVHLAAAVHAAVMDQRRARLLHSTGDHAVRVGGLRAVVHLDTNRRTVTVLALGPRGQVYRQAGAEHGRP